MRSIKRSAIALVALVGICAIPLLRGVPLVRAAHGPEVVVRRVTTLDARGHVGTVFRPASTIGLRIQWIVRNAPPGARQTIDWTVLYSGRVIFHVTRVSPARNGNWSRTATATITRSPSEGSHVFRARVTVAAVSTNRSVVFTVRR